MASPVIEIRGIDEAMRALDGWQGPLMDRRLKKALVAGAKTLKAPIRAAAPVDTGALRKSVRAKGLRNRSGLPVAAIVGPKARHAHLITQGHRIMPHGVDTGRRTRPNPFVERAAAPHVGRAVDAFVKELMRGQGR